MFWSRIASAAACCAALAACDPAQDGVYRNEGPGVELHYAAAGQATANLRAYVGELCRQAVLTDPNGDACADQSRIDWKLIAYTGFNDIDARCDAYLNWLDEKRAERLFVDKSTVAIGALMGGVLGLAASGSDALSYLALAFGFTQAVYSAYNESILLGIEPSTVKTIVNELRARFRDEIRGRDLSFQPDAIYAMRSYLRICMPQTIMSEVNSFSRLAFSGQDPGAARTARELSGLSTEAPKPDEAIGAAPPRAAPAASSEALEIFDADLIADGAGDAQVGIAQRLLCVGVDGDVGPETRTAVRLFEAEAGAGAVANGKLDAAEFELLNVGKAHCGDGRFHSRYERVRYAADEAKTVGPQENVMADNVFAAYLKAIPEAERDPAIAQPAPGAASFASPGFRKAVTALRAHLGLDDSADPALRAMRSGLVDRELENRITRLLI